MSAVAAPTTPKKQKIGLISAPTTPLAEQLDRATLGSGANGSGSGRPRRNTKPVNYAEAVDDTGGHGSGGGGSGGGSGSSRKRQASASPASFRVRTPKSLMKQITSQFITKKLEEEESKEEKSKVVKSLFGSTPKKSAVSKYMTNFVIACEQVCSRDPTLLNSFHKEFSKFLPWHPVEDEDKIRATMVKVLNKRIVERIEAQLRALGPDGSPHDAFLHKSARTPMLSTCAKCKSNSSFLVTICTECKNHKPNSLTLLPYLDWREAVLKQRELDELDATEPKTPSGSAKKKKKPVVDDDEDTAMTDEPASSTHEPTTSTSSPTKRQKTTSLSSSPTAASSPSSTPPPITPSKIRNPDSLEGIPHPDAKWIEQAREGITLRAIQWLRVCMAKAKDHEFRFHGGDIIFLLRNAIFKGRGEVAKQANIVVREMIARWDSTTLTIISDSSEPNHILVFSECLHAKKEMKCHPDADILQISERVRSALTNHCAEDILRFDASLYAASLPCQTYCYPCGVFQVGYGKTGGLCPECATELRMEPDFEFLCESLVWVSLFKELGIDPVQTADASVSLDNILNLMKYIRPYRSLETAGTDSFKLQCYFITHLTFIMTRWGATCMRPRTLFLEEYLFLLANMDVVIKVKDPELVGEFLQALHILDTPHSHPVMQKGYHFLLTHEKRGKMRGNWMAASEDFYKRYHAAYCGIIGMAEFEFDPELKFDQQYNHFFE